MSKNHLLKWVSLSISCVCAVEAMQSSTWKEEGDLGLQVSSWGEQPLNRIQSHPDFPWAVTQIGNSIEQTRLYEIPHFQIPQTFYQVGFPNKVLVYPYNPDCCYGQVLAITFQTQWIPRILQEMGIDRSSLHPNLSLDFCFQAVPDNENDFINPKIDTIFQNVPEDLAKTFSLRPHGIISTSLEIQNAYPDKILAQTVQTSIYNLPLWSLTPVSLIGGNSLGVSIHSGIEISTNQQTLIASPPGLFLKGITLGDPFVSIINIATLQRSYLTVHALYQKKSCFWEEVLKQKHTCVRDLLNYFMGEDGTKEPWKNIQLFFKNYFPVWSLLSQ
jgi:hypothetical protein